MILFQFGSWQKPNLSFHEKALIVLGFC